MKRLLVFGGATEGRLLCGQLAAWGVPVTVCVATAYGEEPLMGLPDWVQVHTGRMDAKAMERMMRAPAACVIDATHPYATEASANIKEAARRAGVPYLRLARPQSRACGGVQVPSLDAAVARLRDTQGNILAATGAKDLASYTSLAAYAQRVYVRVLPTEASIARCVSLGFPGSHIIAMQGPFSQALNEAILRDFGITWLVTRDGGDWGGFLTKMRAAAACGAEAIVIGRPPGDAGQDIEAVLRHARALLRG